MSIIETYRALSRAQKGHARGAPAYSVYINRRLGRILAALAFRIGLTPNEVTCISAVHTFAAVVTIAVAPMNPWMGVLIAVLLVLGYAWDSADGQVARLRGGGSAQGEWLDHFIDALKVGSLHIAVAIGLFRHAPQLPSAYLLIPLGFSVVATTTFFGMLLNDLLKNQRGTASSHQRGGGTLARSVLLVPTDFGLVCIVFVLWGWTSLFLVFYGALAVAGAVFLAMAAVKWFREMSYLHEAPAG